VLHADLKQTIMRFGGFTDGVRRGNGFTEGVMFLGVQQDLLLFLQYYDFQKEALARGDDWMEGEYPQRFKPVVNSARKHAKKSLRLDEHLAMTTANTGEGSILESQDPATTITRLVCEHDPTNKTLQLLLRDWSVSMIRPTRPAHVL
jgi:hypothetical protein